MAAVSAVMVDIVLLRPVADPPVEAATVVTVEVATVDMGDRTPLFQDPGLRVHQFRITVVWSSWFFSRICFGEG